MTTREALRKMQDEDEELVYERGEGWIGSERVGKSLVMNLLRLCAIRLDPYSEVGKVERYTINETGRKFLESYR